MGEAAARFSKRQISGEFQRSSSSMNAGFHAGGASAGSWRALRINRLRNSGWAKFRRRATVPSCPPLLCLPESRSELGERSFVRYASSVPRIERTRERGHAVGHFAVLHAAREQQRDRCDEGGNQKHDQRQRKQKRLNCRAAARLLIRRAAVGFGWRARRRGRGRSRHGSDRGQVGLSSNGDASEQSNVGVIASATPGSAC